MDNENSPMFGEYVKVTATGDIVKWKSYDPKAQTLEIESPTGLSVVVHRHEIDVVTPKEEFEFLGEKKKHSK